MHCNFYIYSEGHEFISLAILKVIPREIKTKQVKKCVFWRSEFIRLLKNEQTYNKLQTADLIT